MSLYKYNIRERLRGWSHLVPVFTNTYRIPERLREIDPNLFVVFNASTQGYEIHSLANTGHTFSLNVPFKDLDARLEAFVRKYSLRRGKRVFREIDEHNEKLEKSIEKQRSNDIRGLADEIYRPARRLAWWGK